MGVLIGVDVGGTFTDILVVDPSSAKIAFTKVPSTPLNHAEGILTAIRAVGQSPRDVDALLHGTTVATNALLELRGSHCGLVTSRGFRDTLELGRRTRPTTYGLTGVFRPLIDRIDRLEVDERMLPGGVVQEPLNEEQVRLAVRELAARGVESLVVHFLHAYESPAHEQAATAIAREEWPTPFVTSASELLPEIREFERLMTAVVNAYVQPPIHRYVVQLERVLRAEGFAGTFAITQSTGGAVSPETAWQQAARTVLSGPAAGVTAIAEIARAAGFPDVISCDMGGTSFDVALILEGAPRIATEKTIAFKVPVCLPMTDIETIGAGGGSIALVDESGLLQVGPQSAGSSPGPVCHGHGGTEPTVTDANVFLGRLDPEVLRRGKSDFNKGAVEEAIRRSVADPLGLSVTEAASGIVEVANNKMVMAIRSVSLERGFDPREMALVAFGGSGPLHIAALARELGVKRVLIPLLPGIASAYGCVLGDARYDFVQTVSHLIDRPENTELDNIVERHLAQGRTLLDQEEGVTLSHLVHEADVQYEGQTHVLRIPFSWPKLDLNRLSVDFRAKCQTRFGLNFPAARCRLVSLRTAVVGTRYRLDPLALFAAIKSSHKPKPTRMRQVYFAGKWFDCSVHDRFAFAPGSRIEGPAVLEQADTTTLLDPASSAVVDSSGNLIVNCGD